MMTIKIRILISVLFNHLQLPDINSSVRIMIVRDHREFFFFFSNSELLFTLTFSSKSTVSRVPEEWEKMTR